MSHLKGEAAPVEKVKASRRPLFKNLLSTLRNRKGHPAIKTQTSATTPLTAAQLKRSASTLSSSSLSSRNSADADASTRSLAPTSIKDKADTLSVASSSQLSTQRTNKSGQSVSTKPTTLLSMGSDAGANRIAQARHSGGSSMAEVPSPVFARLPSSSALTHGRRDSSTTTTSQVMPSSASIQFSNLPTSSAATPTTVGEATEHAPPYTLHNPRNNPNPSSPALDNASMLTLASSTGMGAQREGSLYGTRIDENASIRALPPSRRESQSSLNSKYSTAVPTGQASTANSLYSHLKDKETRPASLRTVATTKSFELGSFRGDQRRSTATMEELSPTTAPPPSISRPTSFQALDSPVEEWSGRAPELQRKATDWTMDEQDMKTAPSTPMVELPEVRTNGFLSASAAAET